MDTTGIIEYKTADSLTVGIRGIKTCITDTQHAHTVIMLRKGTHENTEFSL